MSKHNRLAHCFGLIRTRLTLWIIIILAVGLLVFIGTTLIIAHQLLNNLNEKRLQQNVSSLTIDQTSFVLYGQAIVVKGQVQGYVIAASTTTEGDSASLIFTLMYSAVFIMLT